MERGEKYISELCVQLGSDVFCPTVVGVKMPDFLGVNEEECLNSQEFFFLVEEEEKLSYWSDAVSLYVWRILHDW